MIPANAHLRPVEAGDVPEYPISREERLESHFFVEFHHNRWLSSSFRLLADPDVRAYGLDLFMVAQNEAPVGTLPTDDRLLARLLGLDLAVWQSLLKREITPLHKWQLTNCEGEIRWAHPVVTEIAVKAIGRRQKHLEASEAARERKRFERLKMQILKVGGSSQMAADESVLSWLDRWFQAEHAGRNRTEALVREGLNLMSRHR
ncbi:hypothetical protein [Pseudodonghicola flavimaris]|uniref:DUF1376 domain-containing protein n=1 Tax=Pseudodonghicola flavimaris TaxID=3050036 RepID=A0ABT7EZ27_9RHOB|nr:hypothetical protein [Pseudodonghicola flavimaris]MDK3017611.1 hypothetical protein [Pseudodonghicola flavimaris]